MAMFLIFYFSMMISLQAAEDVRDVSITGNENAYKPVIDQKLRAIKKQEDARCVPEIKPNSGAEIEGFKCWEIPSDSPLFKAGVRNGDVVVSVDGNKLNSAKEALVLFNRIKDAGHTEIVVRRQGKRKVFVK